VTDAELGEQSVDGSKLQTCSAAGIPETRCLNVIAPIGCYQRQCRESSNDLVARAGSGESLQQFLEDQAGRYDRPAGMQCVGERIDLGYRLRRISTQRERPHTGVDQEIQRRVRSTL